MDYNHISDFLKNFKKILFQKEEVYNIISDVIFKYTHRKINIKSIKIKNTTIYIQSSPIFKNEILIHKDKILSNLGSLIDNYVFLDIK